MPALDKEHVKVVLKDFFGDLGGRIDHYAAIISFLTDRSAFEQAIQDVDKVLEEASKKFPKSPESMMAQEVHIKGLGDYAKDALGNNFRTPKDPKTGISSPLVDLDPKPRGVSFRKTLAKVELDQCGFIDKGRVFVGFVDPQFFNSVLHAGETWKDSIAGDHGEYTHRLQWLTIKYGLKLAGDLILDLYRNATNHKPTKLYNNNDQADVYMWDILVDSFQNNNCKYMNTKEDTMDLFKEAVVSNSYRSPNNVNVYLLSNQGKTPFITSYLHSSFAKVELTISKKKRPVFQGFTEHRIGRVKTKYDIDLREKKAVAYRIDGDGLTYRDKEGKEYVHKLASGKAIQNVESTVSNNNSKMEQTYYLDPPN